MNPYELDGALTTQMLAGDYWKDESKAFPKRIKTR